MAKPRYKNIYIYFGCKRDKTKTDKHQPKNIKVRWYVIYEYLQTDGTYKKFKAYGGLNRYHTINERYFAAVALRDAGVLLPYFGVTKNNPTSAVLNPNPANPGRTRYSQNSTQGQNMQYQFIATHLNFDKAVGVESSIIVLNSTRQGVSVVASTRIDNLSTSCRDVDPLGFFDAPRMQLGFEWLNTNRPGWQQTYLRKENPKTQTSPANGANSSGNQCNDDCTR